MPGPRVDKNGDHEANIMNNSIDQSKSTEETLEKQISNLLNDLGDAQSELLEQLSAKSHALRKRDVAALEASQADEESLINRLNDLQQRRAKLIEKANQDQFTGSNLTKIARSLSTEKSSQLNAQIDQTNQKSTLLKHQGFTNWILAQKSLIHVSQIVEIIATGGKMRPTYEKNGHDSMPVSIDRQA